MKLILTILFVIILALALVAVPAGILLPAWRADIGLLFGLYVGGALFSLIAAAAVGNIFETKGKM